MTGENRRPRRHWVYRLANSRSEPQPRIRITSAPQPEVASRSIRGHSVIHLSNFVGFGDRYINFIIPKRSLRCNFSLFVRVSLPARGIPLGQSWQPCPLSWTRRGSACARSISPARSVARGWISCGDVFAWPTGYPWTFCPRRQWSPSRARCASRVPASLCRLRS